MGAGEIAEGLFFGCGLLAWIGAALVKPRTERLGKPCHFCGYDLTGLTIDDNCPECGNGYAVREAEPIGPRFQRMMFWVILGSVIVGSAVGMMACGLVFLTAPSVAFSIFVPCFATLAISSRARPPAAHALCLGALVPSSALILWICHSAFSPHTDPQAAVVVVVLPLYAMTISGYGVLIAALTSTWLRLW